MDYDQFEVEYSRVFDAVRAGLSGAELAGEIERLQGLADTVEDESGRRNARMDVEIIVDITSDDDEEPLSETMLRIRTLHGEATRYDGTNAERIARIEAAFAEFDRIAETANPDELLQLRGYAESMTMLLYALQSDVT